MLPAMLSRLLTTINFLYVSIVLTLSLPHSTNLTFEPVNQGITTNVVHRCTKWQAFESVRPRLDNCLAAIIQLPKTHASGTFHNGGTNDTYLLPRKIISGDCQVFVGTRQGSSSDESTWTSIGLAATQLALVCQADPVFGTQKLTGGWTTTGNNGNIVVYLTKPSMASVISDASSIRRPSLVNDNVVE